MGKNVSQKLPVPIRAGRRSPMAMQNPVAKKRTARSFATKNRAAYLSGVDGTGSLPGAESLGREDTHQTTGRSSGSGRSRRPSSHHGDCPAGSDFIGRTLGDHCSQGPSGSCCSIRPPITAARPRWNSRLFGRLSSQHQVTTLPYSADHGGLLHGGRTPFACESEDTGERPDVNANECSEERNVPSPTNKSCKWQRLPISDEMWMGVDKLELEAMDAIRLGSGI